MMKIVVRSMFIVSLLSALASLVLMLAGENRVRRLRDDGTCIDFDA